MRDPEQVSRELAARAWLQECVLLDVGWLHWGSALRLTFAYHWQDVDGSPELTEAALQHPGEVVVDAGMVLAMRMDNAPTATILEMAPASLSWGFAEVAVVDAHADTYRNRWVGEAACIRLSLAWEDDRRIDIWCRDVEVTTTRAAGAPPRGSADDAE